MKLKVSSITGIGKECKIFMVHLLSREIILFSLLLFVRSKFFRYSLNKDISVIKTLLFYFNLLTVFLFVIIIVIIFF